MKIEKIKPIPKYILERIKKRDKQAFSVPSGKTRYYSYLTKNDKELVQVYVAVKNKGNEFYYKQCVVHGIHSEEAFVKDIAFFYLGGYVVGWYEEGLTKYKKWYEDGEWGVVDDKYFNLYAPIVNKEYIDKFPEYQYSAYELYPDFDLFEYLRIYERYPQAEYFLKFGLSQYSKSIMLLKKTAKDKAFRKWLFANHSELSSRKYYIYSILQAYNRNEPLKAVQVYAEEKRKISFSKEYEPIKELFKGDYSSYINYILKQNISSHLYLDYIKACNYLGLDMKEDKNCFPHDFMHWHDIRIDEYSTAKAIEDERKRKELYAKFESVADKYSNLQYDGKGNYVAIIAKSPDEIIQEGKILDHCVGRMNYDQKFIREESLIFFIRHSETPDEPFVTAEYSLKSKKLLQCYAYHNSKPDDTVMEYVKQIWLPYANKKLSNIKVA